MSPRPRKPVLCQGLETSFQVSAHLRCRLSQGLGWASQPEFNSKHSQGFFFRSVYKTTFIWMWHLPAKERIPRATSIPCQAENWRGSLWVFLQTLWLWLQTIPLPALQNIINLGFRVKGWGWGIVSVFITSRNVQSDNHHTRRSKARGGVICRQLCCDSEHISGELTPRWVAGGNSSPTDDWVWAHVGWCSEGKFSVPSFLGSPLRLAIKAWDVLELVFDWCGGKHVSLQEYWPGASEVLWITTLGLCHWFAFWLGLRPKL